MGNGIRNNKKGLHTNNINSDVFASKREMKIRRTHFIIKRHFTGKRSLEEVIYQAVKSEAALYQKYL